MFCLVHENSTIFGRYKGKYVLFIHYLRKKFIYFNIRVTSKLLAFLVLNTCNVCHYYYS